MTASNGPTAQLAAFAANLQLADIPASVLRKTVELLVDWSGSAVAGHGARAVETITRFALAMGPKASRQDVIVRRGRTSPVLDAMTKADASQQAAIFTKVPRVDGL